MREIKFRAWDLANERMVQDPYIFNPITAGHYVNEYKATFIFYETWQDVEDGIDRPCHIMQFTGLLDKNGKEIYEGDVIRTPLGNLCEIRWDHVKESCGECDYEYTGFCYFHIGQKRTYHLDGTHDEVIGNIYENPELIA